MTQLVAGSPTVTIFADPSPLVTEISQNIRAHGAATHTVSIEAGWLASASRALMLLDSAAGRSAVLGLCDSDLTGVHVVALVSSATGDRASAVCDACVDRHDVLVLDVSDDDVATRAADQVVGSHRS